MLYAGQLTTQIQCKTIHLQYSFNAKQFLAQLKFLFKLQTMLQFPNSTAVRPPAVTMEMVQHAEDEWASNEWASNEWASNECVLFCKKVNCMYFFISFNQ